MTRHVLVFGLSSFPSSPPPFLEVSRVIRRLTKRRREVSKRERTRVEGRGGGGGGRGRGGEVIEKNEKEKV